MRVISCLDVLLVLSLHILFELLGGDLVIRAVVPALDAVDHQGRRHHPDGQLRAGPAALNAGHLGCRGGGGGPGALWLIERMTREAIVAAFCLFPGVGVPITRIRQALYLKASRSFD